MTKPFQPSQTRTNPKWPQSGVVVEVVAEEDVGTAEIEAETEVAEPAPEPAEAVVTVEMVEIRTRPGRGVPRCPQKSVVTAIMPMVTRLGTVRSL